METKIIIAGSRTLEDKKDLIFQYLDDMLMMYKVDYVVSGKAKGVDTIGEEWAKLHNIKVLEFPADWKSNKRAAGFIRNCEMAKVASHLIAFQDCREKENGSNGTNHMITVAKEKCIPTKVIRIFE